MNDRYKLFSLLLVLALLLTGCGGGETNTAPVVSAELPYTVAAAGSATPVSWS